jgi:hypothetical protein
VLGILLGTALGEERGFAFGETVRLKEGSRSGLPVGTIDPKPEATELEEGSVLGSEDGDRDVVGVKVGGNSSSSSASSTLEILLSSSFSTSSLKTWKNSS